MKDILLIDTSKIPKMRLSFKYYEEKNQKKTLEKLDAKECKKFINIISRIQKNPSYIDKINRGSLGKSTNFKTLNNHEYFNELIHLGLDNDSFRLHGLLKANVFYLICIDPNHEVHKH